MKGWTALVAVKQGAHAKSRLSHLLELPARTALANALAEHVVSCLLGIDRIEAVCVLSPRPVHWERVTWMADSGAGLNSELDRAAAALHGPLLVLHADLPFLEGEEVTGLLDSAMDARVAIAPDRHEQGTNGLAFTRGASGFAFGPGSLDRHLCNWPNAVIVRRHGLAFDLDTAEDFAEAARCGVLPAEVTDAVR